MSNRQRIFGTFVIIVVLILSYFIFQRYKPIKEVHHTFVDYFLYEDVNELEEYADLIIVGTPVKEFRKNKRIKFDFNNSNWIEKLHTVSDINILEIIKGNYSDTVIPVIEPAVITSSKRFGTTILNDVLYITGEHYFVMEKDKKYLLFLKKTELDGVYSKISLEQGKYNVDGLDLKEKSMSEHNDRYKKLKESAMLKYKDIFEKYSETLKNEILQ